MAEDQQVNLGLNLDTSAAMASIKNLQRQISIFQTQLAKGSAAQQAQGAQFRQNLVNDLNATGKFSAQMQTVKTTTESFTDSLQKNKLSMGQYFRYAGASTKTFGRLFKTEFETISKVSRERVKDLQTQYIKLGRDANGAMKAISIRPLALDMDNLATKTQIAAQKQALLNQLLKQGSTNLLNFGKNTQWAGRQLMVGFTIPLAMFGAAAAKAFMEVEKQAIRFKRVYGEAFTTSGETEEALRGIKSLAQEYTKYGVAVSKTMELAADAAAMGKMGAELTAQVAEATRLAILGGVEQSEALKTTISLTNAFGTSVDDLAKKTDFLNAVENQTVVSIEDLTIAIPKAGPVVQQLGGDVEDLAFFLTAMKEGGINASEGANALKSGLAALINPTEKASEMLGKFGINIKGIVEANAGDVKGTVVQFAKALDTLDPLNRARAIEQLFGKFQFSRLSTLFQNVIAEGSQASRVLELTNATTAQLAILSERELKKVEESPMFKFQKAVEDLKVTLVPLGEAFLKAVTPILEFGTSILEKFNNLSEGAKAFVVGLTAVVGLIGPVFIMTFGLLMNGIAQIIKGFTFVKGVFNKTGQSSKVLGAQIDYMTQEQLQAAAVASSLDQSHSKLIQTFSLEAKSLDALAGAYKRTIVAQQTFTGAAAVKGRVAGKRKYADGVVSVPGPKGAGDVVPAMLSPGEAIIPVDMAKKYSGLINGMIANNIPGYEDGKTVKGYSNSVMYLPSEMNQAMKNKPVDSKQLSSYIAKQGAALQAPLITEIARGLAKPGQSITSVIRNNPDLKKFGSELSSNIAKQVASVGPTITESEFQKIAKNETDKLAQKYGKDYSRAVKQTRKIRSFENPFVKRVQSSGQVTPVGRQGLFKTKGRPDLASYSDERNRRAYASSARELSGGKLETKGLDLSHTVPGRRLSLRALERMQGLGAKLSGPITNAMSLAKAGKIQVATRKGGDRVTLAATATSEQIRTAKDKANQASIKATEKDTEAKAKETEQTKKKTKAVAASTKVAKVELKTSKDSIDEVKKRIKAGEDVSRNMRKGYAANVDSRGRTVFKDQAGKQVKAEEAILKRARPASTARTATEQAPQKKGFRPGAGTVGMVATGAIMAGTMVPGQVGEIANQLFMPAMLLQMVGPMLAKVNPIVLGLAAAVGVLAAGIIGFVMATQKGEKEGLSLANSMSLTNKKLVEMSEITGTVSATELRQREQTDRLTSSSAKSQSFADSFVSSEVGQGLVNDARSLMKELPSPKAAAESFAAQLALSVSQGVLKPEEAIAIAERIGEELGNASFKLNVTAQVNKLIGPDGEDLKNNPLKVLLDIQSIQMKDVTKAFENAKTGQKDAFLGESLGNTARGVGGGALAVSGALDYAKGAAVRKAAQVAGTAAAKAATSAATKVAGGVMARLAVSVGAKMAVGAGLSATVAGAVVGIPLMVAGIAEAAIGAFQIYEAFEEVNKITEQNVKLSTVAVAAGMQQIANNEMLLDSLNSQYDQREAELGAQISSETSAKKRRDLEQELNDLIAQRKLDIEAMNAANAASFDQILEGAKGMGLDKVKTTAIQQAEITWAGDAFKQESVKTAINAISNLEGQDDLEAALLINVSMGMMDETTATTLALAAEKNPKIGVKYSALVEARGSAEANEILGLLLAAEVDPEGKQFPVLINYMQTGDIDALSQLIALRGYGFDIDLNVNGKEKIDAATLILKDLDNLPDKITKEVAVGVKEGEGDVYEQIYAQWKAMAGPDAVLDLEALTTISLMVPEVSLEQVDDYLRRKGIYNNKIPPADRLAMFTIPAAIDLYGVPDPDAEIPAITTTTKSPIGGGPAARVEDPFEEVLKSLKKVSKASIDAKGGIDELFRLFKKGKDIKITGGIDERIMRLADRNNLDSDFTSFLMNSSKKTRQLLTDIKNGRLELNKFGKAAKTAFATNAIAKMRMSLKETIKGLRDQVLAVKILTANGLSLSDALNIASNAEYANAIATAYNTGKKKKLKKVIAEINSLLKMQAELTAMEDYSSQTESAADSGPTEQEQFLEGIREQAREHNRMVDARKKLDTSTYSFEEQMAILSDPQLIKLYLDGGNLDLLKARIKQTLSPEFMESLFNDGFNKAMNAFDVKEKKLRIKFELDTKTDRDIIEAAEERIEDIGFITDDLEADLKRIETQEKVINEDYEKRIESLDTIQRINSELNRQQDAQLSIADALSQGDIASAAKAAQELQKQKQADAIEKQRKSIDLSRERALGNLTSSNGKTRLQIEEELRVLKEEIFELEESALEPAKQRIIALERILETQVEALTVAGDTKLEWEAIQNEINQAEISSLAYNDAIVEAIGLVEDLKKAWEGYTGPVGGTFTDPGPPSSGGSGGTTGGTAPGALPSPTEAAPDRHISGDVPYNKMVDLFTALGPNNREDFIAAVNLPTGGKGYPDWKKARKAENISNKNLTRASEIMKDGNVTAAELAAANGDGGFSFKKNLGGRIQKFSLGNIVPGIGSTDKVPGLLTPGEFVVRKAATRAYLPQLQAMNSGLFPTMNAPAYGLKEQGLSLAQKVGGGDQGVMYNNTYSVNVNVRSDANPDQIAKAVMTQIKQIDSQRLRSNKF